MTEYSIRTALQLRKMDPDEIAEYQVSLLRDHIRHAMRSPFYRKLYEANSITADDILSVLDLHALPLTSRRDLDDHGDWIRGVQEEQIVDLALTSGTTGPPVKVAYTEHDLQRLAFNEAMAFHGAEVRPDDVCLIAVTLDRCFVAGLAYYKGLVRLGATAIRSGPGQPARQWELISTLNPTVLIGVPTFFLQVAGWAEEHGYNPAVSGVRLLVTIGEPVRHPDFSLTPLGKKVTEAWDCPVRSSYGATELETGLTECRAGRGGHIHPELSLAEIIDDKGNVLPDGQPGELVVTPLGVEGFPLIRFKTGDITRRYSDVCECGWNTARIGPIEGRICQRLKMRGTTIYPETIFHLLQEIKQVEAAYIEVRSAYNLSDEVLIVVGCHFPLMQQEIETLLQARLRVRPKVKVLETKEVQNIMTRDGGRKPKRFFDFRREPV